MRRTIALGLSISWALGAAAPFGLSMLLVVSGETFRGHLFGLVACMLLALPLIALRVLVAPTRARWETFAVASAVFLVGWISLYRLAPSGSPLPESRLRSDFLGTPRYSRLALSSLLPEIDQVSLSVRALSTSWTRLSITNRPIGSAKCRCARTCRWRQILSSPRSGR